MTRKRAAKEPVAAANVPAANLPAADLLTANARDASAPQANALAAGRELPRLLFVTHRASLDRNIGAHGATAVLDLIREANVTRPRETRHVILEYLGANSSDRVAVLQEVHATLIEQQILGDIHGIVLLGGYDVVPSLRFDCLPPALRQWVDAQPLDADDADDWTVWCDDPYGDPHNTGIPEVPVSRIPDGCSRELMFAALRAPLPAVERRRGIRNVRRPFADRVFTMLPGDDEMLVSAPHRATRLPKSALHASHVYIVLHGRHDIGRTLWGERRGAQSESQPETESRATPHGAEHEREVRLTAEEKRLIELDRDAKPRDISDTMEMQVIETQEEGMVDALGCEHMPGDGAVILSGCCWSAQVAASSARRWRVERPPPPRRPQSSVAMAALRDGARAFIGSTGVNYSPINPGDQFYCEPLHREFWQHYMNGHPPARALLIAKHRYVSGMPHGLRDDLTSLAIEHKTLHQYTCLGLGW